MRKEPIEDKPNYAQMRLFGKKPDIPLQISVAEIEQRLDRWMQENDSKHEKEKEEDAKPKISSRLPSIKRSNSVLINYVYPTIGETGEEYVNMPMLGNSPPKQ